MSIELSPKAIRHIFSRQIFYRMERLDEGLDSYETFMKLANSLVSLKGIKYVEKHVVSIKKRIG